MKWIYTDCPDEIDLSVPLMPKRSAEDMSRYGKDPCWQHETLCAWSRCVGASAYRRRINLTPAAADINILRSMAEEIKFRNARQFDTVPLLASTIPSSGVLRAEDLINSRIVFGNVPDDVNVGDLVRRSDISEMFTWMKPVKCVTNVATHERTYASTSFADTEWQDPEYPAPSPHPKPHGSGQLYYFSYEDRREGSEWKRHYWFKTIATAATNVEATVYGLDDASWIASAIIYAGIYYYKYTPDYQSGTIYVPLEATASNESGGVKFTGGGLLSWIDAIRTYFSFEEGATGDTRALSFSFSSAIVGFRFSDDLIVP